MFGHFPWIGCCYSSKMEQRNLMIVVYVPWNFSIHSNWCLFQEDGKETQLINKKINILNSNEASIQSPSFLHRILNYEHSPTQMKTNHCSHIEDAQMCHNWPFIICDQMQSGLFVDKIWQTLLMSTCTISRNMVWWYVVL